MQKYTVNQFLINNILSWVQSGEIAIPEIQRPFVWKSSKVRDLMDSLYNGYPIGYLIAWKNPDIRLKDGTISSGKKIIIDGQQRITALRAAILGEKVVNKDYEKVRIKISFNPVEEKFETLTPAIKNDSAWIDDISEYMESEGGLFNLVDAYCEKNSGVSREKIQKSISQLFAVKNKQLGFIELGEELDIETVTEIFIRINSKGVVLSQADFAMSKIASSGDFGVNLRKAIDYFAHLIRDTEFIEQLEDVDEEFAETDYVGAISWIGKEGDNLYRPSYSDIIRVSFTKEFERGRLRDLVSLLSGRNFETREYEEGIAEESFNRLKKGVMDFVSKTHYQRFLMIIKGIGFIDKNLIRSKNALNFAYIIYLKLREKGYEDSLIEKYVAKWFIMSLLTGRYSGSPESKFDVDIKNISEGGIDKYLESFEESELSDGFWKSGLVRELDKAVISSPFLNVFWAAQVRDNDKGFLSSDVTVRDMITHRGDIHHIFPKKYLRKVYNSRKDYNQIANLAYTQTEVNIKIGDKSPENYLAEVLKQIKNGKLKYGGITNEEELNSNFKQNCIPESLFDMDLDNYPEFLEQRRILMAKKIENYYKSFN